MPHGLKYFMTTDRLGFRHWRLADLPLALALWTDPEVTRLIGGPLSPQQVGQKLAGEIATQDASGIQYWPMFLRVTGEHVGCAGLRPYRPAEGIYELGFHLLTAYWGRGLAEEAARAVIGHAFKTLGANGLFAGHHPENAASRRILEKLGFRHTHDELYPPTGLLHRSYFLAAPERSRVEANHFGRPEHRGSSSE
jgi:RimJ/RimL family protein N-acetyltransferase